MRTTRCLSSCLLVGALSAIAYGTDLKLKPMWATGSYHWEGEEIILEHAGQAVVLEIWVDDWHSSAVTGLGICGDLVTVCDNPGGLSLDCGPPPDGLLCYANDGLMKGWQAKIDSSTLGGVLWLSIPDCDDNVDCQIYGNDYPVGATCNFSQGVCYNTPTNSACIFIQKFRSDFVFDAGANAVVNVDNLSYLAASLSGYAYADEEKYCGTLALDVPAVGAAGTYTIGFIDDPAYTDVTDADAISIVPLNLVPAVITIACQDNQDCDDDNACTEDICLPNGMCLNPPNYDTGNVCSIAGTWCLEDEDCPEGGGTCIDSATPETAQCCDPASGDLTLIDDGNECTDDICDPETGAVTHPNRPADYPCGSQANTVCHNPDTCDGEGNCDENFEPPTTVCREAVSDCDLAEYCTGSDLDCPADQFKPSGDPCGSPVQEECNNPDTCDGAGNCLDNYWANGADCDDEQYCNVGETCTDGACVGGSERDCVDDIPCTTDSCNEELDKCENVIYEGYCLIGDVCYSQDELNPDNDCQACDTATPLEWSNLPEDSPCEDGNPCTYPDTCDGEGNCISGPLDPNCNDTCVDAIEAIEGVTTSTNVTAGPVDDAEASCQPDSNHDVWFRYTASCNGDVFMSTTGSQFEPSNDPVLSVYDNCDDLNEIACDDDSGLDLQAALVFTATIDVEYRIRVAGFEDNVGDIVLNILTVNDCVIDGTCYAEGTINPANQCEECDPSQSPLTWSPRPEGTACGDPYEDECNDADACDGNGVCESNFKPDWTVCTDDGNDCTDDHCIAGVCSHPNWPPGTPCGDQTTDTTCDGLDFCDGAGWCDPNYAADGVPCGNPVPENQCDTPDTCDGEGNCDPRYKPEGTPCDDEDICTGDDVCDGSGGCAGTAIAQAPTVEHLGSRRFQVTPLPPGSPGPVALHVTSPDWTCLSKYIDPDGSLTETPVFQLIDDWGTIVVADEDVVPDSTYQVVAECGVHTSDAGSDSTNLFADHNGDGTVGVTDIMYVIAAFQGGPYPDGPLEVVDIWPCTPDHIVSLGDLMWTISVFQGKTYADTGCPVPCP